MKELKEVETHLKALSQRHNPGRWKPESYIGAGESGYLFLNLKVPHVRRAGKEDFAFLDQPIEKQWKVWDHIWKNTNVFEAALAALHFVNSRPTEELLKQQNKLLAWQKRIDNWAHSDDLSNCYSRILEANRKTMLPVMEKWNSSRNPWERRQSIVGLLFYSRFRKKALPATKILSMVRPLIKDDHYYVQKAVGWTLRECWNLYPEKTFTFMEKHAANIPPAGWTAATEKLSKADKARMTKARKLGKLSRNPQQRRGN